MSVKNSQLWLCSIAPRKYRCQSIVYFTTLFHYSVSFRGQLAPAGGSYKQLNISCIPVSKKWREGVSRTANFMVGTTCVRLSISNHGGRVMQKKKNCPHVSIRTPSVRVASKRSRLGSLRSRPNPPPSPRSMVHPTKNWWRHRFKDKHTQMGHDARCGPGPIAATGLLDYF